MDYVLKPSALKQLEKLPRDIQKRIIKKLDFYCSTGSPLKFAEPLTDMNLGSYRFRVGDWRIVFDVQDNKIIVLVVGNRREIYR